jgi:DNA-binding CsgD family transcriptional regulator
MPKKKQSEQPDLIRDIGISFTEAHHIYAGRLSEPGLTQKDRMSISLRVALIEQAHGNMKVSMGLLAGCEKYILSYGQPEERATLMMLRAMHLTSLTRYEEALPIALSALHMSQPLAIPILTLRCLICCGRICYRLALYTEAIDYMNSGLELARQTGIERQVLLFMYQLNEIKKELISPAESLRDEEALLAYQNEVKAGLRDISYVVLCESAAESALALGDLSRAKNYISLAADARRAIAVDRTMLPNHYLLLARICSAEGDEKGMLRNTQSSIDIDVVHEQASPLSEMCVYEARFHYYIGTGQIVKAKQQLKLAAASAAVLDNPKSHHSLHGCYLKFYQAKGDTARELEYTKKIHEYQAHAQQQVISHRIRHLNAIHELELKEKETQLIKRELNLKSQELDLSNHHLQQRNELLTDLKNSINMLKNENSKRDVVFQTLFKKIDVAFNKEENEKDLFKAKFDSAHADFIRTLNLKHPKLSSAECRICALLHSGFSTKEIATLLSTTLRNIETHRLNIRKKLKLKRTDNLQLILAAVRE